METIMALTTGAALLAELDRLCTEAPQLLDLPVVLGAADDLEYSAPWDGRVASAELSPDDPVLLLRSDGVE